MWQVPAPALHTDAAKIVEETKACEIADLLPCERLSRRVDLAGVSWGAAPEIKAPNSDSVLNMTVCETWVF